jgi:hypothetical protein
MKIHILLLASLLLPTFARTALAQSAQNGSLDTSASSSTTSAGPEPDPAIDTAKLFQLRLEPSFTDRILRSWQYQYQLQEQPAVLVATANGTTQTIPNPNRWLQQHSIILDLSEWFPRSTNLPMLIQTAYDIYDPGRTRAIELKNDICGKKLRTPLECLASGGSWWGRMFSGAKLTFSVAQRDEVQQGILVPTLTASDGWTWGGQVDFNPASLFITTADWKNAISVLALEAGKPRGRRIVVNGNDGSGVKPCIQSVAPGLLSDADLDFQLASCIRKFTTPSLTSALNHARWADFAAVAIPTFQLKVLSQFDFIKQGGILTSSPLLQRSLKNMTFSWDLKRLIAPTTDRLTVGTLYDQALKARETPAPGTVSSSIGVKLCVLRSKGTTSYVNVAEDSTMNACRGLAVALGAIDQYAVACATDRIVFIGAPAGINQRPGESNKPSTNCGWIGGDEGQWAMTTTARAVEAAQVERH